MAELWGAYFRKSVITPVSHVLRLFPINVFRDISKNQISDIAPDAFQGLKSLTSL